jgi:hypothetical protein
MGAIIVRQPVRPAMIPANPSDRMRKQFLDLLRMHTYANKLLS